MKSVPFDGWVSRDQLYLMYPRNANAGGVLADDATPWTWEAYSQVVGSTTEPFVPTHLNLTVRTGINSSILQPLAGEFEIATGAATSEVPFAISNSPAKGCNIE